MYYHYVFVISQLWLTSHPRSTEVLLDTGTPGTSREIYSEDADDGTRTPQLRNDNVSVNSKHDHPPGQPPGNVFERANSPPTGHEESAKPQLLGQKNRAKTPPPGNYFQKSSQKRQQNMR